MKKNLIFLCTFFVLAIVGCNDDESTTTAESNAVAFVSPNVNLSLDATTVNVVFEKPAAANGTVTLNALATNVVYGTDFTTAPTIANNTLVIPFEAGATAASFTFNKLTDAIEGQIKNVVFTIASVSVAGVTIPEATESVQLNYEENPIEANTVLPSIGGPNVPNQVFVDLSSGIETSVERTKWDLGFYSGNDFRVAINGSLKMAAKKLDITDMTQAVTIDETVAVGEGGGSGVVNGNSAYVDHPTGDITQTVIAVSATESDNKVYLVNLGHNLSTVAPGIGSVNPYGNSRGWKKVRVLRSGNDYKLQYADINATTFQEVTVSKNAAFNFTFFSLTSNTVVSAEPEKVKWDINFTPFTNFTNFGGGDVSYAFQDFIVTNSKGGTKVYQVLNTAGVLYNDFALSNVVDANFAASEADQRIIGSSWRNGGGPNTLPSTRDDRFYVVKDVTGNVYKIRFISMTNTAGERGNVSFEYKRLQ
ncbi:MAG: hypothetical protein EOO46_08735 [Flavobacterium sp.]|nr:MAG: hypothetical protein EOO46_08735 [Flavobacterium sp.]